ncbi:MAG: hypothetical protein J6I50_11520 [Clostridia bacterium]|nr:hypothetical protein [Clostridia bacterium]
MITNCKQAAALRSIAKDIIDRCTFVKETEHSGTTPLLLPAGDNGYPSFWVRDSAMMMQSGLVDAAHMRQYIRITSLFGQNGAEERTLANGLCVPAWAVADHINDNGKAVYFPGTYADGDDQGTGLYGFYPPLCDNYFYVMMAGTYTAMTGDYQILKEDFGGLTLMERLEHAWDAYHIDAETDLCYSLDEAFNVDFGFHDAIRKTGLLLSASILRWMAAVSLTRMTAHIGDAEKSAAYNQRADRIASAIVSTFYEEQTGWFYSATGVGHQHDVWGTAVAAYLGLLSESQTQKTAKTLYDAYKNGTVSMHGYIRQIPTDEDYSEASMWECSSVGRNWYQNGGYWATPTGFYAAVMAEYDKTAASQMIEEFLAHTAAHAAEGMPIEWFNLDGGHGMRIYGTSATGAYTAVQPLIF